MEYKRIQNNYLLRIDKGEELIETLKCFCSDKEIKLGSVSGIGASNRITAGLFQTETKQYHSREFIGDYEITNLSGNITTMNGDTYIHIHINFSDKEYHTYGGHLNSAIVSATSEIIIDSIDGEVDREFSEEIGLNLLKFK